MEMVDKMLKTHGAIVGRMLMGLLFVFSGVGIVIGGVGNFAGMLEMKGLPMAILLAWLVVLIKVVAGAALMLGCRTKDATLALILFTIVATALYHASLDDINLFKNLAIIGGLFYVYVYGPGNGWRLSIGENRSSNIVNDDDGPSVTI